ncbi:O-antigen ligase family protein [Arthrobacter sp. JZ12]|uniref:O-antigen ligase family protein n=1 Tax=Arthrobacter sp. JZ12 TaxID=2654190 RepID=UPI002B4A0718|nr:O-antigen ligase family protein [Arthrobacter sp. JZ12]
MFAGYLYSVYVIALVSGQIKNDSTVIVAAILPALLGPAFFVSTRPASKSGKDRVGNADFLLQLSALIFGATAIYDVASASNGEPPAHFNHETAFIAVLILCLPASRFSKLSKAMVVVALAMGGVHYASATTIAILMAGLMTYLSLSYLTPRVSIALIFTTLVAGLSALPFLESLLDRFYNSFGRVDNTGTRQVLWTQAMEIWDENFLFGSGASEPITAIANIRGSLQFVPFHNSFLSLAVFGGLIALVLFAVPPVRLLIRAFRSIAIERSWAKIWAPALVAAFISMSVNPILESLVTALPFYTLVFCGIASNHKDEFTDA